MAAETPSGVVDGVNAVFTASSALAAEHQLFVDRVLQVQGTDYTYVGSTITFEPGAIPQAGALIRLYNALGTILAAGGSDAPSWDTAANILNDVGVSLGLWAVDIDDPWASQDPMIAQLIRFLKMLGQTLVRRHGWSALRKSATLVTTVGVATYDLPEDFSRPVDQTGWNTTTRYPLQGPLSAQEYAANANSLVSSVVGGPAWRFVGGRLSLQPTPTAIQSLSFEYVSRYWVRPGVDVEPTSDAPTAKDDVLCFDRVLLVAGLRLYWRRGKGFDTSLEQDDYESALDAAIATDSPGGILSLSGPRGPKLIGWDNVPDGGWGT